jgi:C4-dicarboxylate-specific signal transduction histidine kinase
LSQVLINLILNGMDASQALPISHQRVRREARAAVDDKIKIAVTDSRPGVRAEDVRRPFGPCCTTKLQGLGTGLPISRTVVGARGAKRCAGGAGSGGVLMVRDARVRGAGG